MDYILKVLNEESSEWEPIEAIKGADGEQGVPGPQGEPGTTEWDGIDNKPFESIGTGLSVDSEGRLNAEGGEGLKIIDVNWTSASQNPQLTPEQLAMCGEGSCLHVTIKAGSMYYYFDGEGSSMFAPGQPNWGYFYTSLKNSGRNNGEFCIYRCWVDVVTGIVYDAHIISEVLPSKTIADAGKVLTVSSDGTYIEWSEPQEPLPSYSSSDVGKVLTVVETSEGEEVQWDEASTPLIFTNGLTESSGTVSWDLNDRISKGTGDNSVIFGLTSTKKTATGKNSLAGGSTIDPTFGSENTKITASGNGAIAWGGGSYDISKELLASGSGSVAIGFANGANAKITASGGGSFAHGCGQNIVASGAGSHAEGYGSAKASGMGSHAEGCGTEATNYYSHAEGWYTTAGGKSQLVIGEYNIKDNASAGNRGVYAFIIGNGAGDSTRSNALTVDWSGNLVCNNIPAPPSTDGTYTLQCTVTNGVATYSWV